MEMMVEVAKHLYMLRTGVPVQMKVPQAPVEESPQQPVLGPTDSHLPDFEAS